MIQKANRWRLAVIPLVAAVTAGLVTSASPAIAVLGDKPIITYNMQGATSGSDSKWSTTISRYARQADVVLLQEVGSAPPPSTRGTVPQILQGPQLANGGLALPQIGNAMRVQHTQWTSSRLVTNDVYFLQTDPNGDPPTYVGGRNNLAIVTQRAADEVVALPNPHIGANRTARATLGVRLGDTWYFSIHASSGNHGGDGPALLASVHGFVTGRGLNERWIVGGDFNRNPATLQPGIPPGARIYATNQATQQGGGELDYVVNSANDAGVMVNRLDGAQADHYAVAVGALRAAAEPTLLFGSDRAVESMQAGGLMDAIGASTANATQIGSSRRNGGDNQSWSVEQFADRSMRFKGKQSGRCVAIPPGATPDPDRVLELWDCADADEQRWIPEYLGDDEYLLHSKRRPELCVNIKGGQSNPSDVKLLILWECANVPNERWLFTPAQATRDLERSPVDLSQHEPGPATVEGMRSGGVMDVSGNHTENGSGVQSFHRTGAPNQGWDLLWRDSQTVAFRGVSSNRCLDIRDGETAAPRRGLAIFDCAGQASQQWHPEQLDNGQVLIHSVPHPELCIDVSGGPENPDQGTLTVDNCTAVANQQWIFTPYDPTGAPEPDAPEHEELFALPGGDGGKPAERTAYYPSWSVYANGLFVKNLDTEGTASKLTTLAYAFENIDPVNLTCFANNKAGSSDESNTTGNDGASDAWADYQMGYTTANSIDGVADQWNQPLKGNFNQLKKLKARYPQLKVIVSLGGWTYSKYFSDAAATDASRKKFVSSCIDMYIRGNLPKLGDDPAGGTGVAAGVFDGFDIDWEFPGSANGHTGNHFAAQDTANYTLLLAEFRRQLDALGGKHYRLTAAVPSGPRDIDLLRADAAQYLDMAHVMTYDMHGAWETTGPTNFQAPLFESPVNPAGGTGLTVNDAIDHYLINGFPAAKLSLGVPFYGRGWTGVPDGGNHGLYQRATGPSAPFPFSQQPGVAMYKELAAAGKLTNTFQDVRTRSAWVYDGSTFYSIETPQTLAVKRQFIKSRRLGGIMMYSLEADQSATMLNAATGFDS